MYGRHTAAIANSLQVPAAVLAKHIEATEANKAEMLAMWNRLSPGEQQRLITFMIQYRPLQLGCKK